MIEKSIDGYIGYYSVTDDGKVFSLPRFGTGNVKRQLKYGARPNGYLFVALSVGNVRKQISVHRLVAEAFLPRSDSSFNEVNHINGDKTDNRVENLEWCNSRINKLHAIKAGLFNNGEKHQWAKITEEVAKAIYHDRRQGYKYSDIMLKYGVTKSMVYSICTRKSWKHLNLTLSE